ncbi:hypothetical protein LJR225_001014 [Phenylobacterium sp. LjRoot225]|uniref:hypothetical protein n=1 Tax=Phenylobacterium sp. LjRoot225 TaxID=3342285 RepID=UPI003ECDB432
MHEDPTLFGSGRYPDAGPLAVLARLCCVIAVIAVVVAVFLPPEMVPQFTRSNYLEHFAAFYVLMLSALAAMQRARLRRVATGLVIFATLLEASHLPAGAPFVPLMRNWVADLGGVSAAVVPIVIERFRRRFPRPAAS